MCNLEVFLDEAVMKRHRKPGEYRCLLPTTTGWRVRQMARNIRRSGSCGERVGVSEWKPDTWLVTTLQGISRGLWVGEARNWVPGRAPTSVHLTCFAGIPRIHNISTSANGRLILQTHPLSIVVPSRLSFALLWRKTFRSLQIYA